MRVDVHLVAGGIKPMLSIWMFWHSCQQEEAASTSSCWLQGNAVDGPWHNQKPPGQILPVQTQHNCRPMHVHCIMALIVETPRATASIRQQ
jgi:hypothetical protein